MGLVVVAEDDDSYECIPVPYHVRNMLGHLRDSFCDSGPLVCATWESMGISWKHKWSMRWNRYDTDHVRL
jgi:hypothetical protein